ncbi:hypothetical protein AARAC_001377 [Aspergillus arachidicola]|uniref:VPS4-associated protein 1 n=1 Tax=Aspergillus arachidicola TaxID=656916 RepID=A0A2G7G691_9EURO|nr:hypothetical protein AARAC_001377 [Aspergillus arachidicola]
MSGPFQNIYHLRRVADTAAKACYVCHKPSSSVMITPDNKDFFYVCPVHLKDRHFCSPIVDTEAEEKKKKEEALAKEIEKIESLKNSAQSTSTSDDGPRIFALHKNFYQMRIDRLRNLEAAKRNRQRLQDPSFFPSVPSGGL